jgi:glycosyltransferase involved in cell wall biosynthesis
VKITWASNAPWLGTGYGTQTYEMVKRLKADGHDVVIAANAGLQGRPLVDPELGVDIYPNHADAYGNDVLPRIHQQHLDGDRGWIISLFDVWVYKEPQFEGLNFASWVPVDHYPVPPKVAEWCRKHPAIAMSKFGQTALAESGISAHYAPHALDLSKWQPVPSTIRSDMNVPEDAFLVMINAANKGNVPPRKSWGEMFQALSHLIGAHDDVYVYIHTEATGAHSGIDLRVLLGLTGIPVERVRFPDQFDYVSGLIDQQTLAKLYTAADVLLATSMGEGFGIPVIEAQACGTPVIVTNFSAQPELVGAGWTVGFQPWADMTTHGSWFALPEVASIVDRLKKAREAKGDAGLRDAAIAKVAAEYDADKVYDDHWRPILAQLEMELNPPTRQQRRAKRRKAA